MPASPPARDQHRDQEHRHRDEAQSEHRPRGALLAGLVQERDEKPEEDRGHDAVHDASDPRRGRVRVGRVSREASTTPITPTAMPAIWMALGRSPRTKPTVTGTTTSSAVIGATTLMGPTA